MKKPILTFTLKSLAQLFFLLILLNAKGQNRLPNQISQITPGGPGMYPSVIQFNTAQGPAFINGQVIMLNDNGNLESISNLKLVNSGKDQIEQWHYRYQQTYKGIPVENAIIAVHVRNGKIDRENGNFIKNFPARLSVNKTIINQDKALQYALDAVKAKKYAWQDNFREQQIKKIKNDPTATNYPKAELVWYNSNKEKLDTTLQLAYRLDIFAISPMSHDIVYIDAQNGKILGKQNLICKLDEPGKANTVYSGQRDIVAYYDNNLKVYQLRDVGRHILTFDAGSAVKIAEEDFKDFEDNDNSWFDQKDQAKGFPAINQYGADAHWGAEMVYDFYKNKFNRIGLDGKSYPLISYVNTSLVKLYRYPDNVNAFWDGQVIMIGSGDIKNNISPLASLDIIGHEFTHAVTQFSSGLTFTNNESSALNEGFSDIFGILIDFENKNNANWTIGEETGYLIRDIKNPKNTGNPDCYEGEFWDPSQEAHQNSTVLSYWFYLLSEGGSGTNDLGDNYKVAGIGKEKAGKIAYNTNVYYLNPNSNYLQVRKESIAAAEALFGKNSNEVIQVRNAWLAVGLGDDYTISCSLPLSGKNICPGSPISVDFESDAIFTKGNVFTLYLSDVNGSFKNKKAIGFLGSTYKKGTINGFISSSIPSGDYKIRVESTNPPLEHTPAKNIFIKSNSLPIITSTEVSLCPWQTATLTVTNAYVDKWKWNNGLTTQSINVRGAGIYSANVIYKNGCESPIAEIKISKPVDCSIGIYRWWSSEQEQNIDAVLSPELAMQIHPNPSKSISTISFTAKQSGTATLKVYNAFGKVVATIFNGMVEKGKQYQSTFNGSSLSAGMYLIKLQSGKEVFTQKLLLTK